MLRPSHVAPESLAGNVAGDSQTQQREDTVDETRKKGADKSASEG